MIVKKLQFLLSRREKTYFFILLVLSLVYSVIELVGISIIIPFISVATNPALLQSNKYLHYFYNFLGFNTEYQFIKFLGITIIVLYIIRGGYSVGYNYLVNRFSFGRQHSCSIRLFNNYLGLPYIIFARKNSSDLTKTLVTETYLFSLLLNQVLLFFAEIIVFLLLYVLMLVVDWQITLTISIFIVVVAYLMLKTVSKKIKEEGAKREEVQGKIYKIINESLSNFKIIKLSPNKNDVVKKFDGFSSRFAKSFAVNATLQTIPRNLLETIGFSILMCIILFIYFKYNDIKMIIPIISAYILALYRMLPAANRVMSNYNNVLYAHKSLDIVYDDIQLQVEQEKNEEVAFNKNMQLKNVYFKYEENKNILTDINLNINKGSKVAVVGESGCGKSTLIDLISGINKPSKGQILIDEKELTNENIRSWRQKIGYIPQDIYLFDGTVAENVSFGHKYDEDKIVECFKKANIYDFLKKGDGINTFAGEGGILLSGGQKQRIGIARALYGDPEVLILDEATSALDVETEAKIIEEIFSVSGNKTVIIVSHRLSTIGNCDRVYRLDNDNLTLVSE